MSSTEIGRLVIVGVRADIIGNYSDETQRAIQTAVDECRYKLESIARAASETAIDKQATPVVSSVIQSALESAERPAEVASRSESVSDTVFGYR